RLMFVTLFAVLYAAGGPAKSAEPSQGSVVHHDLIVSLNPAGHRIKVRDRIRVPGELVKVPFEISLNADLNLQTMLGGPKLVKVQSRAAGSESGTDRDDHNAAARVPVNVYRVEGATPEQDWTGDIDYEGTINYVIKDSAGEYARAFSESPGLIESRGVYLAG